MQTCGTYVKNKKSKNQQVLYVKMFGDFSLKYQGRSLIAKKKKETQFALVLQLIFHSGEEGSAGNIWRRFCLVNGHWTMRIMRSTA